MKNAKTATNSTEKYLQNDVAKIDQQFGTT